jgi:hypothetical protein
MWKVSGKTTTLQLFLDSLSPKNKTKEGQLDDLKETRRYWKLKEEAQDRTLWRTQFGRSYGPVAKQTNT